MIRYTIETYNKDTYDLLKTSWAQIREPEFGRIFVIPTTRNVRITWAYNDAIIDDIDLVLEPSERRLRDQRIGWCKKPRSKTRTPDVSDIARNVLLVLYNDIAMSSDVIVSIITSQWLRKLSVQCFAHPHWHPAMRFYLISRRTRWVHTLLYWLYDMSY